MGDEPVNGVVSPFGGAVEPEPPRHPARALGADVDLFERQLARVGERPQGGQCEGSGRQPDDGDGEERCPEPAPAPSIGEAHDHTDERHEDVVELEGEASEQERHLA